MAWAKSQNLTAGTGTESVGGEGTVFGWWIDQVVDMVYVDFTWLC